MFKFTDLISFNNVHSLMGNIFYFPPEMAATTPHTIHHFTTRSYTLIHILRVWLLGLHITNFHFAKLLRSVYFFHYNLFQIIKYSMHYVLYALRLGNVSYIRTTLHFVNLYLLKSFNSLLNAKIIKICTS